MDTPLDTLQQKLQHLTNRVELIKNQFDTFSPTLNNDENLSTLVAKLQTDVGDMKLKILNFNSSLNALDNTYSTIVSSVENNNINIQDLQSTSNSTLQEIDLLKSKNENLTQDINNNSQLIASNQQNIEIVNTELNLANSKISSNTQLGISNETSINLLTSRVDDLIASVDFLNAYINNYVANNSPADNELFFIVNGTYVSENEISSIIDGSYLA